MQGESSAALTSVQELLTDNSDVRGLYLLLSRLALRSGSGYTAQSSAKLAVGQGTNNNKVGSAIRSYFQSLEQEGKHVQCCYVNCTAETSISLKKRSGRHSLEKRLAQNKSKW